MTVYPNVPHASDFQWHASIWRWLRSHPLGDEMIRWVAVDGDRVVGHLAATPQYYRVNGRRVVAHTPADYMVLPEYGFQALSLMRKYFRATKDCVACDMLPAVIAVETRLGAVEAGKLTYQAKLLDVSRLPAPNLDDARNLARRLAGRFSNRKDEAPVEEARPVIQPPRPRAPLPTPVKAFFNKSLLTIDAGLGSGIGEGFRTEELKGFDESFDDFFEKIASVIPCMAEKDAAFLSWRYGPGSPQHPVKVLGVRGPEGGGLLGYAVLKVTQDGQDGYPLDLMALPGRPDVARTLLWETVRYFRRERVSIIRYRFLDSPTAPRARDIQRLGFFPRNNRRNTLLAKFTEPDLRGTGYDTANWSYNVGDGEASFWVR